MKKSIENLAVGDWVLMEGMFVGLPAREPVKIVAIMPSMVNVERKPDRNGAFPVSRKSKKGIIAVFDDYDQAEEFSLFIHQQHRITEDAVAMVRRENTAKIKEFAKKYEEAK